MHELSIMERVLELAVDFGEQNGAERITQIQLVAGTLSNIVPRWAELFFRMVAKGTIAEEAELRFCVTPARILCRFCGETTEFTSENMLFHCGHCGCDEISLVAGKEFRIESIEIVGQKNP